MREVWKYEIPVTDAVNVEMPQGAEILHIGQQFEVLTTILTIWALVDPDAELVARRFVIHGTGHPFDHEHPYLATVITAQGSLVWHVFDGGEGG